MVRKSLTDRRKSIYLFVLVFVIYALIYMTKNCYSAAMTSIVSQGIMTKSQTGLIAAAFYLIYAPFQIVGGIAADRFAPGKLILIGTFGAAVCNLAVFFFSQNYIAMLVIWSLNAIIQFGIWPSIFKIITSQLASQHRSRGVFFINFSSTIGLVFSYTCAAFITDWTFNFLFSAIILFACVLVFLFCYGKLEKNMVIEEESPLRAPKAKAKPQKGALGKIIRSGVPLLLIVYVIQSLLNLGLKALVPVMMMEEYAVSPGLANALNIVLILATPLGLFFSRLPIWSRFREPTVVSILFLLTLPMLAVITLIGKAPLILIMCSLVLLMILVSSMSVFFSYISKSFELFGCSGTLSGLFNCMASLGIFLANYVFTRLAESFGWGFTTKSWLVITIVSLTLSAISILLWKRFWKKLDQEA